MSVRFLLDTSVVSAPVAKKPNDEILRRIDRYAHESAIAAPVWHELIYGVWRLPRGRRRAALTVYLEDVVGATFPILPYDDTAAAWHGRERSRLEKQGTPTPYVDGQIASIAHTHGLVLVTANTKDFVRFRDLDVQDWFKSRRYVRRSGQR